MNYRDDEPKWEIIPPAPKSHFGHRADPFVTRQERHESLKSSIKTAVASVYPDKRDYDPVVEMAVLAVDEYADVSHLQRFAMHSQIAKYFHPELKAQDVDELPTHQRTIVVENARHELAQKYDQTLPATNADGSSAVIMNPARRQQMNDLMTKIAENMAKKDQPE